MPKNYSAFSYKSGDSFIHRLGTHFKIILMPIFGLLLFALPDFFTALTILFLALMFFYLKFSLIEQLESIKPILYYALLIFAVLCLHNFISLCSSYLKNGLHNTVDLVSLLRQIATSSIESFIISKGTLSMLLKLLAIIQISALFYKTSTSLEIKSGIGVIESKIRKLFKLPESKGFTNLIWLFISFIPMVYSVWNQLKLSWQARHGKNSIKMYYWLLPILISLCMKKAYNISRAIAARS